MIAIDSSKQQALGADPKAIQQINFTVNLDRLEGCIGFIDFMLKDKSLLDYTNLFSPNDFEKNDKVILNFF